MDEEHVREMKDFIERKKNIECIYMFPTGYKEEILQFPNSDYAQGVPGVLTWTVME